MTYTPERGLLGPDPNTDESEEDRIARLKKQIGFSDEPVQDAQGHWTIGYGQRLSDAPGGPKPNVTISEPFASEILRLGTRQSSDSMAPHLPTAEVAGNSETAQNAESKTPPDFYGPTLDDAETGRRARVIFGETSGVWPALKDANGKIHDPNNWDPVSADELARARAYIGIVSSRNPITHSSEPD